MTKASQLDLYLTNFRYDHPDWFRKKLYVSPPVFDHLVELIEDHHIFHNNLNVPQHPIHVQLAIFLVRVGHYGNSSAPEYVAQWAGVLHPQPISVPCASSLVSFPSPCVLPARLTVYWTYRLMPRSRYLAAMSATSLFVLYYPDSPLATYTYCAPRVRVISCSFLTNPFATY